MKHITTHRFTAMGTSVEFQLANVSPDAAQAAFVVAQFELDRLAMIFTRFDERSELCRLNRMRSMHCSEELFEVVELAVEARADTAGRFDPTILNALVAAGYDDDFDVIQQRMLTPTLRNVYSSGDIVVDRSDRSVSLTGTSRLDLGGIAKGWIADRLAEQLALVGSALVNAGGDISTVAYEDDLWHVDIPAPYDALAATMGTGGLATSGVDHRNWVVGDGKLAHHVIDPRTGTSAQTDLLRVTVIGRDCAGAEIDATRLLLAGRTLAEYEANSLGISAILIGIDDSVTQTGDPK